MTGLSRRGFLRGAAVLGLVTVVPAGVAGGWVWASTSRSNVGHVRFERPLAIPPLDEGVRGADGRVGFNLRLQPGTSELLPGRRTPTWGVNNPYLGPTLRVRRGDVLAPVVRNDLPEATTLHWHGAELPAVADGGPHAMIAPSTSWATSWRVDQPAATLWYHPHPHGVTKDHVYRGVAGLLLVEDGQADGLLPQRYGIDDIPVVIQDKNIADEGTLDTDGIAYSGIDVMGLLGSEILVNGTWGPVLRVRTERVRLRLLNASNARIYDLVLDDGRPFAVVAGDNGLLPRPVQVDSLLLSPGERAEIVLELGPGEQRLLRSRPPDLRAGGVFGGITGHLSGGDDEFDLLRLDAATTLRPSPPLPDSLPGAPPVTAADATDMRRRMVLGDFTINGQVFDHGRIDAIVPLGTTEVWRVHNDQGVPHNFHIHNAAFHVVDINGRPAPPAWQGRKDTVFVAPGSEVTLAVGFGQYPDPAGAFMYHCHLLAHEDAGMMGQFVIVEPGTEGQVRASAHQAPHTDPTGTR